MDQNRRKTKLNDCCFNIKKWGFGVGIKGVREKEEE